MRQKQQGFVRQKLLFVKKRQTIYKNLQKEKFYGLQELETIV